MSSNLTNVGLNQNKQKAAENNRSTNQSVFDKISALLAKVSKDANDIGKDGKFYGFVLYTHRMTPEQFRELFKDNKPFITEVIASADKGAPDKSGTVLEIYVDVPQLSDFLPKPDLKVLFDLLKTKSAAQEELRNLFTTEILQRLLRPLPEDFNERVGVSNRDLNPSNPRIQSNQTGKIEKNIALKSAMSKLKRMLEIVTMYPRVYKYVEDGRTYVTGQACEVNFPVGKDFPTMGYGYFTKSLDGYVDLGTEGIDKEIKQIIEGAG